MSGAPWTEHATLVRAALHGTGFTLVAVTYYPALLRLLAPFSLSVSFSRVVLGVHYPSDVIAGAVIVAAILGWLPPCCSECRRLCRLCLTRNLPHRIKKNR